MFVSPLVLDNYGNAQASVWVMLIWEMMFENDKHYFPTGRMRVLAVDDNSTCLIVLEALLRKCHYNVTSIKDATTALQILREKKKEFDLVISEVHLPDMDAFKLLEEVTDTPVVLMSSDDDKERVRKGIICGACDYLLKPVRIEELKNIWQHVVRRKISKCAESSGTGSSGVYKKTKEKTIIKEELDHHHEEQECVDDHKQKLGQQYVVDEEILPHKQKKPRVVWLPELHRKFVAAVDQMGVDKAVPKRILELMNVEGITRENVASHLQKYRMFLEKSNKEANTQQAKSFGGDPYYEHVDNKQTIRRERDSYMPANRHQWGHSDNYPNNMSMMMTYHTMNNQIHEPFVDDFSITCFSNNNNYLMLDDYNHNNSWTTSIWHGQQGSTNVYLPTSTRTSSASHLLMPITHNMNFDSAPSRSVRQEFTKSTCCLQVESRYDGDDQMQPEDGSGGVSMQLDDEQAPAPGEREQV